MVDKVTAACRACGGHADDTCDVCQAPLCWGCVTLADAGSGSHVWCQDCAAKAAEA